MLPRLSTWKYSLSGEVQQNRMLQRCRQLVSAIFRLLGGVFTDWQQNSAGCNPIKPSQVQSASTLLSYTAMSLPGTSNLGSQSIKKTSFVQTSPTTRHVLSAHQSTRKVYSIKVGRERPGFVPDPPTSLANEVEDFCSSFSYVLLRLPDWKLQVTRREVLSVTAFEHMSKKEEDQGMDGLCDVHPFIRHPFHHGNKHQKKGGWVWQTQECVSMGRQCQKERANVRLRRMLGVTFVREPSGHQGPRTIQQPSNSPQPNVPLNRHNGPPFHGG